MRIYPPCEKQIKMEFTHLYLMEEREKSFKKWPFGEKDKCNVRKMAEAGFYSVATGDDDADAAKCFYCGKEMDGWEATDDPWEEHKSHAAYCKFVQLGKKEEDLLLADFLSLAKHYMVNELTKRLATAAKARAEEHAKRTRRLLK